MRRTVGTAGLEEEETCNNNNNDHHSDLSSLWVRTEPSLAEQQDPRLLHTILTSSLRSLWGSWEPYSGSLRVVKAVDNNNNKSDDDDASKQAQLIVQCPRAYVRQVQAALTMVTLPAYMEDNDDDNSVYRFDVVNIQHQQRAEHSG